MLEKIGLPAKPSVRGNNWVVDASHCQGCSSQFTFINRKHHCRRCGGLFCGTCTQQRMYLRGQGDAPVRICEPCKTLEEAARFEMRHGHKNRAGRGPSKPASNNEDDVLTKILGNESVSSDKESVDASCSNTAMSTTTPDELRRQAAEEKKQYKVLKSVGKTQEALKAFKRGKELERQAEALEIESRKTRRKAALSSSEGKSVKRPEDLASELKELGWTENDLEDADKKPANVSLEGELSTLLKEVSKKGTGTEKGSFGIEKSEVVAIKKRALAFKREGKLAEAKEELKRAKILEKQIEERELLGDGEDSDDEFSSLIRSMDIDKDDVLATGNDRNRDVDFDFDRLLRMDDGDFDVNDDDFDDPEMSAALQSLGWTDEEPVSAHDSSAGPSSRFVSDRKTAPKSKLTIQRELLALKKNALALRREGKTEEADRELAKGKVLERELEALETGPKANDFSAPMDVEDDGEDVTDTDMNDPSYLSVLQNLGWKDGDDGRVESETPKQETVASTRSKGEIQRELLALKRKSLALRRQGNVEEAEEVLKTTKGLEARLAEIEAPKQEPKNEKTVVYEVPVDEKPRTEAVVGEMESNPVRQRILAHKQKAVSLKRGGKLEEAKEELKQAKLLEKNMDSGDNVPIVGAGKRNRDTEETIPVAGSGFGVPAAPKNGVSPPSGSGSGGPVVPKNDVSPPSGSGSGVPAAPKNAVSPPKPSSRDRFKLQQESLRHKRQALKLRREGQTEEADAEFELAKNLESQLEALTQPVGPTGGGDSGVEDLLDPQLLSALREIGIEGGTAAQTSPEKTEPVAGKTENPKTSPEKTEPVVGKTENNPKTKLEEEIKAEKVKAVRLKRSGKQAEALEALRRAKLLEKKMNSLA